MAEAGRQESAGGCGRQLTASRQRSRRIAFGCSFGGERVGAGEPDSTGSLIGHSTTASTLRDGDYFPLLPDKKMRPREVRSLAGFAARMQWLGNRREYKERQMATKQECKDVESTGQSDEAGGGGEKPC